MIKFSASILRGFMMLSLAGSSIFQMTTLFPVLHGSEFKPRNGGHFVDLFHEMVREHVVCA